MTKLDQLRQKIDAEQTALEEFVRQANNEVSARNGRLAALKETLTMLTEDEAEETDNG